MLVRSKQRWRDPSLCAATIGISVSETWCCFFEKMSLAELTREWPEWSRDCLDGERVMPAWLGLERHGAGGLRVIGAGSALSWRNLRPASRLRGRLPPWLRNGGERFETSARKSVEQLKQRLGGSRAAGLVLSVSKMERDLRVRGTIAGDAARMRKTDSESPPVRTLLAGGQSYAAPRAGVR